MYQNSATYNEYLTTLAQAFTASDGDGIGAFLFPAVQVNSTVGSYKKRDINSGFRRYDTRLARGRAPRQIHVHAEDAFFNCKPNGLDVSNWKFDLDQAGGDDWREDNLRELMSATLVNRELEAVDIFRKAVAATSGAGENWSTGQSDPIDELDQGIIMIHSAIGRMPKRGVIGLTAWRILKNHPKVRDRIAGLKTSASLEAIKEMLMVPDIDLRIGAMPYQPEKLGKAANKQEIVGSEIFLFYGEDAPTRNDASACKDFTLDAGGPEVHTVESDLSMETIDRLLWSSDRQVTCPAAAFRITVS